jgi:hypothetical protein
MFVVIHHKISDPKKFWDLPEDFLANIPVGLRLHSSFPTSDGARATCLWECSALPKLREFIEGYSAGIAENEYVHVDESKALGLPKKTIQEERVGQSARA